MNFPSSSPVTLLILLLVMGVSSVEMRWSSKFLTFKNLNQTALRTVYRSGEVQTSVGTPYSGLIEIFSGDNITIRYKCFVNNPSGADRLSRLEICFNSFTPPHNVYCYRSMKESSQTTPDLTMGKQNDTKVSFHFYKNLGAEVVFWNYESVDEIYNPNEVHCTVTNRQGSVKSSYLYIHDHRPFFRRAKLSSNRSMLIDPTNEAKFICFDDTNVIISYVPESQVQFNWSYCKDETFEDCEDFWAIDSPGWPVRIFPVTGNLHWYYVPKRVQRLLNNKRLKCSIGNYVIGRYLQKIRFREKEKMVERTKSTAALWSPKLSMSISKFDEGYFFLDFPIKGLTNDITLTWTHGGHQLTRWRGKKPEDGNCFLLSFSSIPMCKGPFAGRYYSIELRTRNDYSVSLRRHYIILSYSESILSLSESTPQQVFAVDRTSASFRCQIASGSDVLALYIRGVRIHIWALNKSVILKDIASVNERFKNVMSPLNISTKLVPVVPKRSNMLTLSVYNPIYRNPEHNNLSSDFYATCSDTWGKTAAQTIFTVLPMPDIEGIDFRTEKENITFFRIIKNEDEILKLGALIECRWQFVSQSAKELKVSKNVNGSLNSCTLTVNAEEMLEYENVTCTTRIVNGFVDEFHFNRIIYTSNPINLLLSEIPLLQNSSIDDPER